MFVAIRDPSIDDADATWLPPPFGFPTTCKPLEEWKKSTYYKQIKSKWSITWTNKFLDDYTRTVMEWLGKEVRKQKESKSTAAIYPADFTLDGADYSDAKLTALEAVAGDSAENAEALRVTGQAPEDAHSSPPIFFNVRAR